jgi:hypothetical protein
MYHENHVDKALIRRFTHSGPICAVALLILIPAMPNIGDSSPNRKPLGRVDVIGGLLSVAWPICFAFAVQEGGSNYPWRSSIIIGTFIGGIVGLILFVTWELWTETKAKQEPIFPIRLLRDPIVSLALLSV